jgi:hypothetical protein
MANGTCVTTAAVKLRFGPGVDTNVLAFLTPKTTLELVGVEGDWVHVKIQGKEGYVSRSFVLLPDQGVAEGFLSAKLEPATTVETVSAPATTTVTVSTEPTAEVAPAPTTTVTVSTEPTAPTAPTEAPPAPSLTDVPLEPPPEQRLPVNPKAPLLERLAANIWNRYGNLLVVLSNELKIDPGVAVAVLAVESGGRGFGPDGRMIIRFENQVFFDNWGKKNEAQYRQHFTFMPEKRWMGHKWRPSPDQPWWPEDKPDFHGDQGREWTVFNFARGLSDTAAKLSISMGGPQIMGFNFATLGFESVQQMFDAFSASERNQIIGFFDFVQGPGANSRRVLALQAMDFNTFASMYNGPGQAAKYGGLIKTSFDAFHKLKGA